jgi:hypothetical protein
LHQLPALPAPILRDLTAALEPLSSALLRKAAKFRWLVNREWPAGVLATLKQKFTRPRPSGTS